MIDELMEPKVKLYHPMIFEKIRLRDIPRKIAQAKCRPELDYSAKIKKIQKQILNSEEPEELSEEDKEFIEKIGKEKGFSSPLMVKQTVDQFRTFESIFSEHNAAKGWRLIFFTEHHDEEYKTRLALEERYKKRLGDLICKGDVRVRDLDADIMISGEMTEESWHTGYMTRRSFADYIKVQHRMEIVDDDSDPAKRLNQIKKESPFPQKIELLNLEGKKFVGKSKPRDGITPIAIYAMLLIAKEKQKNPTASEVIERLKGWAGNLPLHLVIDDGVEWIDKYGKVYKYCRPACEKTIQRWYGKVTCPDIQKDENPQ